MALAIPFFRKGGRIGPLFRLLAGTLMAITSGDAPLMFAAGLQAGLLVKVRIAGVDVQAIKGGGTSVGISLNDGTLKEDDWKSLESLGDLKQVRLDGKDFGNDELARICNVKSVEALKLGAWTRVTEAGLPAIAQLPNLQRLELRAVKIPLTDTLTALADSKHLSTLSFTGGAPGLSEEGMKALGKITQIRDLTLEAGWAPTYTSSDFKHLTGLKNLEVLSLAQMVLAYEDGLVHLKELHLKKLRLVECYLTDADFGRLKDALPSVTIDRLGSRELAASQWDTTLERYKKEGVPKFFSRK